ncbi:hypothetical protein SH668x_000176 [Planctomicrobium sp. SH668]|uniref:hypothetical protein n=1 Tax=Planctomicrobium sp. SH668 TaxID=3448126 RepID=UPI003F5B9D9A
MTVRQRARKFITIIIVAFLATMLWVAYKKNQEPQKPTPLTFQLSAGDFVRSLQLERSEKNGDEARRAHHINFRSSNGPIEITVTPFVPDADPKAVQEPIGKANSDSGTIDLSDWNPLKKEYVIQMKTANTTDVILMIHYAPEQTP